VHGGLGRDSDAYMCAHCSVDVPVNSLFHSGVFVLCRPVNHWYHHVLCTLVPCVASLCLIVLCLVSESSTSSQVKTQHSEANNVRAVLVHTRARFYHRAQAVARHSVKLPIFNFLLLLPPKFLIILGICSNILWEGPGIPWIPFGRAGPTRAYPQSQAC
jgi:hypothetical protein